MDTIRGFYYTTASPPNPSFLFLGLVKLIVAAGLVFGMLLVLPC